MGRFHAENPSELIREARLDAGLTQAELARRAGLRQPSLAQMESGTRNVSEEMLDRVLEAADYRPSLALERNFNAVRKAASRRGLRNVRVFGSVARGEDNFNSDIDLLVTPDKGTTLFDLALFGEDVRTITGFTTDVIVDDGPFPSGWQALREAVPV
ncbi:helix-turn-helix domain-containing protein [Brevibacterium zhoupengii]|uniref:helix-turn-helix domain-containing protein n=1 Tax=Brevibacterium zhoupengii TaxID=2898795 RepID=UPI001E5A0F9B|nr:XRE family transcriptional regulator [Brevibacterium zhoupengii]